MKRPPQENFNVALASGARCGRGLLSSEFAAIRWAAGVWGKTRKSSNITNLLLAHTAASCTMRDHVNTINSQALSCLVYEIDAWVLV